jgi:hypothetical protein
MNFEKMKSGASDLHTCLAKTDMCDRDNPWLLRLAEEIVNAASTPAEKALRIALTAISSVGTIMWGIHYPKNISTAAEQIVASDDYPVEFCNVRIIVPNSSLTRSIRYPPQMNSLLIILHVHQPFFYHF